MVKCVLCLLAAALAARPAEPRVAVLVELFTSEGCSSCPPADELLIRLVEDQPIAGVEVIALSEHVDYWDDLGWRDPFSRRQFTVRQQEYALRLDAGGAYTPQAVVDGRRELLGSDAARLAAAVREAAKTPKGRVVLSRDGDSLHVRVADLRAPDKGDTAEVMLAITESNLASNVARGENTGRRLRHAAVLRSLTALGQAHPQFDARTALKLDPRWKRADLRAVVFVQERKSRRVAAAASIALE